MWFANQVKESNHAFRTKYWTKLLYLLILRRPTLPDKRFSGMGNLRSVTGKDESYFGIQSPPTPHAPPKSWQIDGQWDPSSVYWIELPGHKVGKLRSCFGFWIERLGESRSNCLHTIGIKVGEDLFKISTLTSNFYSAVSATKSGYYNKLPYMCHTW